MMQYEGELSLLYCRRNFKILMKLDAPLLLTIAFYFFSCRKDAEVEPSLLRDTEVDTVDSFQGREKDVMILSCVRSQALGFLTSSNRLCVALTRARQSLIVIGNALCLNSVRFE